MRRSKEQEIDTILSPVLGHPVTAAATSAALTFVEQKTKQQYAGGRTIPRTGRVGMEHSTGQKKRTVPSVLRLDA